MKFSIAAVFVATLQASLFQANAIKQKEPKGNRPPRDETLCNLLPSTKACKNAKKLHRLLVSKEGVNLASGSPQHKAWAWMVMTQEQTDNELSTLLAGEWAQVLEVFSLAALYYSTSGDSWDYQYNFLSGLDRCEWYGDDIFGHKAGVDCDVDGKVTSLKLGKYGLAIGPDANSRATIFANSFRLFGHRLANLTVNNKLEGPIPSEIGLLGNLELLDLSKYMVFPSVLMQTPLDHIHLLTLFVSPSSSCKSYSPQQSSLHSGNH
jgi:hypothetical protein